MLDQILKAFTDFERTHHVSANVLDINHTHFQMLLDEYPLIFGPEAEVELGFHICLHSDYEQVHPSVRKMAAWYEASVKQRARAKLLECVESKKYFEDNQAS